VRLNNGANNSSRCFGVSCGFGIGLILPNVKDERHGWLARSVRKHNP
jgi:hypothetical protein